MTALHETLLAEIYADPGDLERRAVYADCLQAAGDPRGELIALQLLARPSREQARRARELLDLHRDEWLGRLALVFCRKGLVFRHGFPAVARLEGSRWETMKSLVDEPAWATLTELDLSEGVRQVGVAFLEAPAVRRGMVSLKNICLANFGLIASSKRPWPLRRIGVNSMSAMAAGTHAAIREGEALAQLEQIDLGWVRDPGRAGWLVESEFWPRLRKLDLTVPVHSAAAWAAEIERFFGRAGVSVKLDGQFLRYRFERADAGTALTVSSPSTRSPVHAHPRAAQQLADMLGGLSSGFLTEVVVDLGQEPPDDYVRAITRAIRGVGLDGRFVGSVRRG